jgi:hypothetical protein
MLLHNVSVGRPKSTLEHVLRVSVLRGICVAHVRAATEIVWRPVPHKRWIQPGPTIQQLNRGLADMCYLVALQAY